LGLRVLSLFDGMSCGQLALQRLGIEVDTYYASEIDKYAIQVTQANFPETIQVGDVCELKVKDYQDVDLILAGSPCQGFSFAGKQLAFDDPRSALFFEFIRMLKGIKPKYFLLENVKMKQQFQDVITEQVSACYPDFEGGDLFGSQIKPVLINSALVSAQNRQRLYWTNIPNIEQPKDKGIVLKDILEENPDEKYKLSNAKVDRVLNSPRGKGFFYNEDSEKIGTLIAGYYKQPTDANYIETKPKQVGIATDIKGHDILKRVYSPDGKSPTLNSMGGGNREPKVVSGAWLGRYKEDGATEQKLELNQSGKSNSLTTAQKDSVVVSTKPNQINSSKKAGGKQPYMQDRVFHKKGKSHALTRSFADRTNVGEENKLSWRKLTPLECERLQTVPDNYTNHVSKTQRYKMLGNGMTVDVIVHILNNMEL
jgi:DNA (cytosine-5)-methyltransferase 3A|tara:strand:- start:151 stop:1425 length:1275 start_codon:yes stop_codon:yes gene_type:complete